MDRAALKTGIDETSIRSEITEAMLMAGVMAYVDWKERKRTDKSLSDRDLTSSIYVAMRRRAENSQR